MTTQMPMTTQETSAGGELHAPHLNTPHLHTTRTFYDTIATEYAERFRTVLEDRPLDRAILGAFAELVLAAGGGPVADLGSGPGRVTAHLHGLGLAVHGIDLSPRMVEMARADHPGVRFEVGSLTDVDAADGTLAGVLAWYSIIHTPGERLPEVMAEFHRVLAPGGHLLLGFQVGEEPLHLANPFGHEVSLDFNRLSPDHIATLLKEAGFTVTTRARREPEGTEAVPQAYLFARKEREEA
ncbi:class I SAM-dependent DNA methyltransferase [Streptomyces sp. HUAS TT7]|uniref:class I SAM-dependent DNA methyltransferase n=1 Tax=Streptomyces sp. HUAS TT7 TaxID=3447507 RepID=UPI003F65A8AC